MELSFHEITAHIFEHFVSSLVSIRSNAGRRFRMKEGFDIPNGPENIKTRVDRPRQVPTRVFNLYTVVPLSTSMAFHLIRPTLTVGPMDSFIYPSREDLLLAPCLARMCLGTFWLEIYELK